MIHASTYQAPKVPEQESPIAEHFDVDDRFLAARSAARPVGQPRYWWFAAASMVIADVAGLCAAASLGWGIRGLVGPMPFPGWVSLFALAWVAAASVHGLYPGWGVGAVEALRARARAMAAAFTITVLVLALTGTVEDASRIVLIATALLGLPAVSLARALTRRVLSRAGRWGVPVAIYGAGKTGARVAHLLSEQSEVGYRPIGLFEDDPAFWGREISGVPVLGDANLVHPDAPIAIVTAGDEQESRRQVDFLLRFYRDVVYIPDLRDHSTATTRPVDLGGLLGLKLNVGLASSFARGLKRAVDTMLTAVTLPMWGGVISIGAILVWLGDRESPFYRQSRIGRGGASISVLKLRTMVPDADGALERAFLEDPTLKIEWEATSKLQNDPRITRVGAVLRRLSIDELPQLLNVLRGDMALVGPRPLPAYHESRLGPDVQQLRRRVRPGITGLWQVSGRSDTGDEGIEWLDAYYVRNWTPWLDTAIMIRTFRAALAGEGAY